MLCTTAAQHAHVNIVARLSKLVPRHLRVRYLQWYPLAKISYTAELYNAPPLSLVPRLKGLHVKPPQQAPLAAASGGAPSRTCSRQSRQPFPRQIQRYYLVTGDSLVYKPSCPTASWSLPETAARVTTKADIRLHTRCSGAP